MFLVNVMVELTVLVMCSRSCCFGDSYVGVDWSGDSTAGLMVLFILMYKLIVLVMV